MRYNAPHPADNQEMHEIPLNQNQSVQIPPGRDPDMCPFCDIPLKSRGKRINQTHCLKCGIKLCIGCRQGLLCPPHYNALTPDQQKVMKNYAYWEWIILGIIIPTILIVVIFFDDHSHEIFTTGFLIQTVIICGSAYVAIRITVKIIARASQYLKSIDKSFLPVPIISEVQTPGSDQNYCMYCGKTNPKKATFCQYCGKKVSL
jgi:ribosomal protein L40E